MKHTMFSKYINILLALSAVVIMSTFFYGLRVIYLIAIGVVTTFLLSKILSFCFKIEKKGKYDLSIMITPIIITLLMPANVPEYIIVVGCIVAMLVAVFPFGGSGNNIFNPAAVAVSFITLSWPQIISTYPIITQLTAENLEAVPTVSSHIINLRVGGIPKIDLFDLLLGKFTGPMGTTVTVVILAAMLFLLFTKTISLSVVLSSLITVVVGFSLFSNAINIAENNVLYHICCSSYLFGITFMASDPITSPNKTNARIIYGVVLGILFILYQYFGATVSTFVFPLLIVNALAHTFDNYEQGYMDFFRKINIFKKKKDLHDITPIEVD